MKIRTKLLLALVCISLFPPVAAYVALIGNPRIALALRMNEYEAQQGRIAQKLQANLETIGAAMEESVAETYRMRVEAREHDDAERKRKLANAALRSGVAQYEVDLNAVAALESQQIQEGSAASRATGPEAVEQRETQLLKDLGDSPAALKSNAERFIQLSDSASPMEGEFVHEVVEPQVDGELSKSVQNLANETDYAAAEYRHNIETALKDSYKESILIVLVGLVASFLVAAAISRAVIAPIQQLRDAALQLGRGRMDTRIPLRSGDELGELAGSFNLMAESITHAMAERGQAQVGLTEAHEKLKGSMGELECRNREASALSEMADLLQSCFTLEEASSVIASSAQKLFPGFSGAVFVFSASRNVLEAIATWGASSPAERIFGPGDCWALRRGRLHHSESKAGAIRCAHFGVASGLPSLCTPLMAHGETLGVLCLVTEPGGSPGSAGSISEFNVQLAVSVGEQAALSFANLKLREKLRYQSVRDPLTGLFNRRYLEESLERELPRAQRKKRSVGVIMLDVDQFKKFNDMFGHDAGDAVLRELGDFLVKFVRRGDIACRYGGEEFTLVFPECNLEDTRRRAEDLRTAFQQLSIKYAGVALGKVTLSLGVAALPEHGASAIDLLGAADQALLLAKQQGRDRVLVAEFPAHRSERISTPVSE